jgi:hypothetical protein
VDNLAAENLRKGVHPVGDTCTCAAAVPPAAGRSPILDDLGFRAAFLSLPAPPYNVDEPKAWPRFSGLRGLGLPVVFPAHPRTLAAFASSAGVAGLRAVNLGYLDMLALLHAAALVMTDSGGVQKEACFAGTPCVTLRPETEWVETVASGWNRLAWGDAGSIAAAVLAQMTPPAEPLLAYGDGHAAEKIAAVSPLPAAVTRLSGPGGAQHRTLAMSQALAWSRLSHHGVARFLPVETYGEFRTALSVISFVSTFCLLGTAQAATMAAAQGRDGSLIPLLRQKLLANGLGGVGLAAAAAYYAGSYGNAPGIAAGLLVGAVVFPVYNVADICQSWVNEKARFAEQAAGESDCPAHLGAVAGGAVLGVGHLRPILAALRRTAGGERRVCGGGAAADNRDVIRRSSVMGGMLRWPLSSNSQLTLNMAILNTSRGAEVAMFAIAMQ